MLDLNVIREQIDGIDKQLVDLFEQRMKLTKEVAEYKIQTGKKVLDTQRERAKIEAVTKLVKNEANVHAIDDLFSQIMANSRKGQYQLLEAMGQTLREPYEAIESINKEGVKIVYQGVPGAYTQEAACNFFGEDCDNYGVPTWRDVMEAVKNKEADYGVLPIENSTTGSVVGVYDLLQEYDNYIIAETFVNIDHVLVGLKGTDINKVTTVYSHPQGIMQCDHFLNTHKDWQRIHQANTAMAAKMLLSENNLYTVTENKGGNDVGKYKVQLELKDPTNYKWRNGDSTATATIEFEIVKAQRKAPTSVTATGTTYKGGTDGKLNNVDSSMEYRKEGENEWHSITGDTVEGLSTGKYYVRYKDSKNYYESSEKEVYIANGQEIKVNVPGSQVGYTLSVSNTVVDYNESSTLTFKLNKGYSKTKNFAVKVNGETVQLNNNNQYTKKPNNPAMQRM